MADQKGDGMVLGSIPARRFQAHRHSRLANQRQLGAAQGPAPNAALGRRERRAARRGRGLWPQARCSWRSGQVGSLQWHDSRLHAAQPDREHAPGAWRRRSGVRLSAQGLRGLLGVYSSEAGVEIIAPAAFIELVGAWRWVYVIAAIASLYLNVFVLVVQSFVKVSALNAFAPTQSELPFAIPQAVVLVIFILIALIAVVKFRPVTTVRV